MKLRNAKPGPLYLCGTQKGSSSIMLPCRVSSSAYNPVAEVRVAGEVVSSSPLDSSLSFSTCAAVRRSLDSS